MSGCPFTEVNTLVMPVRIFCHSHLSRVFAIVQQSMCITYSNFCSTSSTNQKPLRRLQNFFKNEKDAVEELNSKFALPYVNVWDLDGNLEIKMEQRDSNSYLMKSTYQGILHRPAIPLKYILTNVDEFKKNLENRKLHELNIDLVEDIIKPYERMILIDNEKERCEILKNVFSDDLRNFWAQNPNKGYQNLPADIAKKRAEVAKLSCILSLLSWVYYNVEKFFFEKALQLPNLTHPSSPVGDESAAEILKIVNEKPSDTFKAIGHVEIGKRTSVIRQSNVVQFSGHRTYYLFKEVADLEQALVRYTLDVLKKRGFHIISCPNILHGSAFEGCGIPSTKMKDMLYHIDSQQEKDYFISGTSEVGIASYFANHAISLNHLPMKVCCVSTCNRKETNSGLDPRGLYRVHHFTKVEMFGVTADESGSESEELFKEFLDIQELLFSNLGLHFRVMNMPTLELGLPAYQKVDIEAWMKVRGSYGEISSTSNCTDYQSRRLHILYKSGNEYKFAHTVNGTACAIPRVVIALLENNQNRNEKVVHLPEVLKGYMERSRIDNSSKIAMEYIGPNQSRKQWRLPTD